MSGIETLVILLFIAAVIYLVFFYNPVITEQKKPTYKTRELNVEPGYETFIRIEENSFTLPAGKYIIESTAGETKITIIEEK